MKRSVLTLMLILSAFILAYGQNTPMDIILVLDTSSGMSSSYENVSSYITGSFLSEFLRVGDTFHLITFSNSPRLDVARRITSIGDAETIIGRMLIQYPIENGSNIGSAISFAEQYAASLPARSKKIVLISTGGGDTNNLVGAAGQRLSSRNVSFNFVQVTPGQPLANLPSSGRSSPPRTASASPSPAASTPSTSAAVASPTPTVASPTPAVAAPSPAATVTSPAAAVAAPSPAAAAPSPSAAPASTNTAQQSQTETVREQTTVSPPSAGTTAQTESAAAPPVTVSSGGVETDAVVRPAEVTSPAVSETASTGIGAAAAGEPENTRPAVETETREPVREASAPSTSLPEKQKKESGSFWSSSMFLIIGIIILALLILGIIVFFATRRLGSSPNRVMAQAASSKPESKKDVTPVVDHSKELAKYAAVQSRQRSTPYDDRPVKTENVKQAVINPSGPLLLNLFVEDQNTAIGKRNIHSLKSGYSLSVGGGQSDFLIFLVQIPANIGEIRRNGSQCSFIPKKPKYFPDLGSNELRDCINKTIRIISDRNYEMRFRFEMYEDPLVELNRILMSVNVPG